MGMWYIYFERKIIMPPWLIVLIIVLGVYVLIIITNVIFVLSFYTIMKKHEKAIRIILKSKHDSLSNLVKLMKSSWNLIVDEESIHLLDETSKELKNKDFILTCDETKKKLSYIKTNLTSVCDEVEEVKNNDDYILIVENVDQLDSVYRSNVIMHNADVLGYNYWVRFLPFRYFWLLIRIKQKGFIS